MTDTTTKKAPRRGIYLLPNLFTTAGLFCGFYAVVASMNGDFEKAAIAIFVAMLMDAFDGRVARMTNTQTAFGGEYDSLADMVSFCVAPALVTYNWALNDLGKFGWLAAFIFVAGGALRLARFNTQIGIADKRYFQGLATPASAAIPAGLVWLSVDYNINVQDFSVAVGVLTIVLGLLMVSNFRYYSFKDINWKGKVPFAAMLASVLILVTIAYEPAMVLFAVFASYALSGPILTLWLLRQKRTKRSAQKNSNKDLSDSEN